MGERGLTHAEAERLRGVHGPNVLPSTPPTPLWRRFVRQFRSPLIYVLLFAAVVETGSWAYDGAHGIPLEAVAIAVTLLINAAIGTWQEHRSEAALEKLREMAAPHAWVFRDGRLKNIPSAQIVPGDLIRLEQGDRLPADGQFEQASGALVDESILTGESIPVDKHVNDAGASGTLLVGGRGQLRVTRTGATSAMGRLAVLLSRIDVTKTPLERRLHRFGNQVAAIVLVIGVALIALGVLAEGRAAFVDVVFFAVALAVAALPEELPAVLALTLSSGVERMARRNALVRRLSAVEALGSVTVIATDKTGTLTEGRLEVRRLDAGDTDAALRALVHANDADLSTGAGDPLDVALLAHAQGAGYDVAGLRERAPRLAERPFDAAWRFMRASVDEDGTRVSYLKGAPETILARCALDESARAEWLSRADEAARDGLRVLALAKGADDAEEGLTPLGLVGLWDPPRPEVPDSIRKAQSAGIRVLMVTGDHPTTAAAISRAVGIDAARVVTGAELDEMDDAELRASITQVHVFARTSPEQKLRIVDALQADGQIVAVTGDGVNDAPALKRADVGVAMGKRGSDVTREVADLILLDDDFATIVIAIEEGRSLYENIQKFLRFMFSTSLGILTLLVVGAIGSWVLDLRAPDGRLILPLTAIQILWINLLVDGPPSFVLGRDRNPNVMARGPRAPDTPLMDGRTLAWVVIAAAPKAVIGLGLLLLVPWLGLTLLAAQLAVFAYEYLAQLVYIFPARRMSPPSPPNRALWIMILGLIGLQGALLAWPLTRAFLGLTAPEPSILAIVGLATLLTWGIAEGTTRILRTTPPPSTPKRQEQPSCQPDA